jgi:hypothetical protein
MAQTTGLRGPQGKPGPPGPSGPPRRRGERGKTGERGPAGKATPPERKELIEEVNGHIEAIYKELDVQLKRISQIQQQVDELREKVKKLSE